MRQDVFRVAYDEANAELLEITKRFEELKGRKAALEGAIQMLGPVLGAQVGGVEGLPVEAVQAEAPSPAEPANYSFNQVAAPLPELEEETSDPFQRRVRNALKLSNGNGRDQRGLQPAV